MTPHRAALEALALGDFEAAGVTRLVWSDGPNGVRGAAGATAFPSSTALAATFDRVLARRFGAALAREALAAGRNAMLAPGLDIARVPFAGRVAESLGEDPLLTGELGGHVVSGLQSEGVLAVPKHFVVNNFEYLRTGRGGGESRSDSIDVEVPERALRELYLEPFRRALTGFDAGAVLGSYNRLGGRYVCEHPALFRLLREEWSWTGLTVPDFLFAVRDAAAALEAGLDLPGLDELAGRTPELVSAVPDELLEDIDAHVRGTIERLGIRPATPTDEPVDLPESRDLAEEILVAGAVLLRNDGILPLTPTNPPRVALVGIENPAHVLVMGGSASVGLTPERIPKLAEELAARAVPVETVAGVGGDLPLPALPAPTVISVADDDGARLELHADALRLDRRPDGVGERWTAVATARWIPEHSGRHRIVATFGGQVRIAIDGAPVIDAFREASPMVVGPDYPATAVVAFEAGRPVEIRVEFDRGSGIDVPPMGMTPGFRVGIEAIEQRIADAARAAGRSDVAIAVVGRVAGEAMDLETLRLPADQEALLDAVSAANPRTVVVVCAGGPVVMPWVDRVAAVLHVWHPGERFASGLLRMLLGDAEPGGRLPISFPASDETAPAGRPRLEARGDRIRYDEELAVGYRWYDEREVEPAFPFGHGLRYASFELDDVTIDREGDGIRVAARVRNISPRAGRTVLQVYVRSPESAARPRALAGFLPLAVEPGETVDAVVEVPLEALRTWHPEAGDWVLDGGDYEFEVGWSSRDIVARGRLRIEP